MKYPRRTSAVLFHAPAILGFAALAVIWTYPLPARPSTHLLGGGAGDNVTFLWNFWWMRAAIDQGHDFFRTSHLFAPWGVDLTLHTHTALLAGIGATVLGAVPPIAALNATVIASVWLSAVGAYLLAWRLTGSRSAAAIGGLIFGGSPFMSAHLHGHFNLTTAWTIPLFALAACTAIARGAIVPAMLAGLLLGLTAYVDYYFLVYQVVFAGVLIVVVSRTWRVRVDSSSRWQVVQLAVVALILADIVLILSILATGGFSLAVAGVRISARSTFNPLQAFWILVAIALWLRFRPRLSSRRDASIDAAGAVKAAGAIAAVAIVVAAPVIWNGAGLFARGEYETQRYLWRNAPKGIDVATVVAGNPFHRFWGGPTRRFYGAADISDVESCAWLGIVPSILMVWALRRRRSLPVVRTWAVLGGVFLLWALGPHLMAFGSNTGLILPQVLMRYVPVVSNARVPGRAIVMVYLALSVLCAVAVAELLSRFRNRTLLTTAIAAAIVMDYLPAPYPLLELRPPAVYETIRERPESGAVCELPLGIRDGFGEIGSLDERVLFYQTIHQRPIAGGFVARLPQRIRQSYEADPLFSALLRLSSDDGKTGDVPLPDAAASRALLRDRAIRFIVLDRTTASAALVDYVRTLGLSRIAGDGERDVFIVLP